MQLFRFGLAALVLCLGPVALPASEGGFTATLSAEQQTAAGLAKLSPDEAAALNTLVAREVAAARSGGVRAFGGTFLSRRLAAERSEAGLDHLSIAEQERLNEFVAASLAAGPAGQAPASKLTKIDSSVKDPRRLEVHGSVSLMYGWGSGGREMQGRAFDLRFTDPAGRYSLELRYLRTDGTGFVDYAHRNELDWRPFR